MRTIFRTRHRGPPVPAGCRRCRASERQRMMALRRVLLALVLPFCCPWRAAVASDRSGGGGGSGRAAPLPARGRGGSEGNLPAAHMSSLSPRWRTPTRRPHGRIRPRTALASGSARSPAPAPKRSSRSKKRRHGGWSRSRGLRLCVP